jgi:hypothetical protein
MAGCPNKPIIVVYGPIVTIAIKIFTSDIQPKENADSVATFPTQQPLRFTRIYRISYSKIRPRLGCKAISIANDSNFPPKSKFAAVMLFESKIRCADVWQHWREWSPLKWTK